MGTHGAWLPSGGWAHPCAHMALGLCQVVGTPCSHVALGLCLWVGHSLAHTWRLGSALGLATSGAVVMAPDSRGIDWSSGPMINKSSVRTQFFWVLYQDLMFMGSRILNIIISFRNIIIFIIINIINKIINKFERKY